MMKPTENRRRLLRTVVGAMLGAAVLMGDWGSGARAAEDDDDDGFDVKIVRRMLTTLGLRRDDDGINYRERSPLVVPPSRNLVPPATAKAPDKNPAWPNDPDVKRRKDAKIKSKDQRRNIDWDADTRPMRPSELHGNPQNAGPGQPQPNNVDVDKPLKPSELGYKGGLFSGLFGGSKEEYTTFTGESPRASLIEPPSGYRTPSPNQPYGVGREKWTPPKFERHDPVR
jgi:hypothetical protein